MPVGLGCMRLTTGETIRAALDAGVSWLDTARAYGTAPGGNEGLVGREAGAARIVTKCGMRRDGERWEPDGRASTVLAEARASRDALGRVPDVLLLHAPDPRVRLATSVRALVRAREEGLTRAIGLSNVTRGQLDTVLAEVPEAEIAAVEVALGAYDDAATRGGVLSWAKERGALVFAHAPFGGPKRAARVGRDPILRRIAARHGADPWQLVVAYLLALGEHVIPLPGASRPETAARAGAAGGIALLPSDLDVLDERFPGLALARHPRALRSTPRRPGEVVILMGIAGAGKSRLAADYVARGYARLNRDTVGGTLKGIAQRLERLLVDGGDRVVLDNTYVSRASRSEVVRLAGRHGLAVRCVHVDLPLHEAQVNVTERMLDRHEGQLLGGADLVARSRQDPNLFAPPTLARMDRDLERPGADEGFSAIEVVTFARDADDGEAASVALPLEEVLAPSGQVRAGAEARIGRARELGGPMSTVLFFGWIPTAVDATGLEARLGALPPLTGVTFELGLCTHGAGPPVCWCRPPLPGLWLAFRRRHRVSRARSVLVASRPAHRALARNLGIRVVSAGE